MSDWVPIAETNHQQYPVTKIKWEPYKVSKSTCGQLSISGVCYLCEQQGLAGRRSQSVTLLTAFSILPLGRTSVVRFAGDNRRLPSTLGTEGGHGEHQFWKQHDRQTASTWRPATARPESCPRQCKPRYFHVFIPLCLYVPLLQNPANWR